MDNRCNKKTEKSSRPALLVATAIAVPVWAFLILNMILLKTTGWTMGPSYLLAPGLIPAILLDLAGEGGAHNPNMIVVTAFSCLMYFLLVLAGVIVWRRIRSRFRNEHG